MVFVTHMLYIVFFLLEKNNNCEKGEAKKESLQIINFIFRQMNSSGRYTGNLRIWTFVPFKNIVRYSSIRSEGTGERETG